MASNLRQPLNETGTAHRDNSIIPVKEPATGCMRVGDKVRFSKGPYANDGKAFCIIDVTDHDYRLRADDETETACWAPFGSVVQIPGTQVLNNAGKVNRLSPDPVEKLHGKADPPAAPADLRVQIRETRDRLYEQGGTVLISHILLPMIGHAAHLFYAPDDVLQSVWTAGRKCNRNSFHAASRRIFGDQGMRKDLLETFSRHKAFLCVTVTLIAICMHNSNLLKCTMENHALVWARRTQTMNFVERFVSISFLMCIRMLVSNVLPFTSALFAYLITKAMPPGQGWQGTFYLLFASMPAGAMVPVLDAVLSICPPSPKNKEMNNFDHKFRGTRFLSFVTDFLPFSCWVRPWFMQPVFAAAKHNHATDEAAASAALLAGHFMIWSGPATTMYQRNYIPDWPTCVFIQPLGLLEDVAIVLATFAGESPQTQKEAEIGMYVFMLIMNVIRFLATRPKVDTTTLITRRKAMDSAFQHVIVGLLTLIAMYAKYSTTVPVIHETTTTTTTTFGNNVVCETTHTDVKTMATTIAKVTIVAVTSRFAARCLIHCLRSPLPPP